jgi:hypothetical protein
VCFVLQYSARREYQIRFERAICMGIEGNIIFALIQNVVCASQGVLFDCQSKFDFVAISDIILAI